MPTITTSDSVVVRVAHRLARLVGQQRYNMWFDRSAQLDYDDESGRLTVRVPNQFVADWIERNFQCELRQAAESEVAGAVELVVNVDTRVFSEPVASSSQCAPATAKVAATPTPSLRRLRHSLESFIVGPNNELAYAAAKSFADQEAGPSNTLFIHGGCGLGKTHLLHGICRRLHERRPGRRVHYTTAEQFTNEFLRAVRNNCVDGFRHKIRGLDLLAVDDVHFLAGKQATQQEFLHSFDAMDQGGARVVMVSDSHPKLIRKLTEALVSRCLRGMVVQVTPPDTATRIKIVRALAQQRSMSLLDSVIKALATRYQGSVREIEGSLTKLHALARLANDRRSGEADDPIGHSLLNRLFESEAIEQPHRSVPMPSIVDVVVGQLDVTRGQILGTCRYRRVVLARSLIIYLARRVTSMSLPEIAVGVGLSSHSTVISALRRIENSMDELVRINGPGGSQQLSTAQLIERSLHALRTR